MKVLRASTLNLIRHCGESQKSLVNIADESAEGAIGSCVHAALAASIRQDGFEIPKLMEVYLVPLNEKKQIEFLYYSGMAAWEKISEKFIDPKAEEYLTGEIGEFPFQNLLSGHADVLAFNDDIAFILDWKTGQQKTSVLDQLYAYAYLVFSKFPEVEKVQVVTAWLRLQETDIEKPLDRADVKIWAEKLLADLKNNEDKFNVGDWCRFCPRNGECPANTANIQSCLAIIKSEGDDFDKGKTKFELIQIAAQRWETFKMIRDMVDKRVEQIRQILVDQIIATGEPLPCGEGLELTVQERGGRYEWEPAKAVQVLQGKGYTLDEILSAATFSMDDIATIAGNKAAKGMKGKDIAKLKDELKAAGAVNQKTNRMLVTKKQGG